MIRVYDNPDEYDSRHYPIPPKLVYEPENCINIDDPECLEIKVLSYDWNYNIEFYIDVIGTYPLK